MARDIDNKILEIHKEALHHVKNTSHLTQSEVLALEYVVKGMRDKGIEVDYALNLVNRIYKGK